MSTDETLTRSATMARGARRLLACERWFDNGRAPASGQPTGAGLGKIGILKHALEAEVGAERVTGRRHEAGAHDLPVALRREEQIVVLVQHVLRVELEAQQRAVIPLRQPDLV